VQLNDRADFESQLQSLCAGFNVPVGDRAEAYWRGLGKMELRTFARVVEHCLGEEGPEKIPTTKQCWMHSKALRRSGSMALAAPERPAWSGDKWDLEANFRLLAHIRANGKRFAPDAGYSEALREATASPLTRQYTAVLVRWKNAWTEDVRAKPNQSAAVRTAEWRDCMARADAEIERLSRGRAAAEAA
jgi:hypothetical protein